MAQAKCTGLIKGIESKTENMILLCKEDLYIQDILCGSGLYGSSET